MSELTKTSGRTETYRGFDIIADIYSYKGKTLALYVVDFPNYISQSDLIETSRKHIDEYLAMKERAAEYNRTHAHEPHGTAWPGID